MISRHNTHSQIWKKIYGFYFNNKLWNSLTLRPGLNFAVVSYNEFRGNLFVLFWTMCNYVKGPCDIKSFKISTAYEVWFSRYRPSSMKFVTNSALVLVFINFLWAVYVYFSSCTMILTCALLYLMMCMLCRRLALIHFKWELMLYCLHCPTLNKVFLSYSYSIRLGKP